MAKFAIQYRKEQGEHGTYVIEETGLCIRSDVAAIEANWIKRYTLQPLPNATGVVLKVLDGSNPTVITVRPSTYDLTYKAVKIFGGVNAYAPVQPGGSLSGQTVLSYTIRYQTIGVIV